MSTNEFLSSSFEKYTFHSNENSKIIKDKNNIEERKQFERVVDEILQLTDKKKNQNQSLVYGNISNSGINKEYVLKTLLKSKIKVSDFSFETEMLIESANCNVPIVEIPIQTIYISNNKHSNFKPVKDSFKIIKTVLKRSND